MKTTTTIQLITSGVIAWIAAKLGILFPVLMTLMALMMISSEKRLKCIMIVDSADRNSIT